MRQREVAAPVCGLCTADTARGDQREGCAAIACFESDGVALAGIPIPGQRCWQRRGIDPVGRGRPFQPLLGLQQPGTGVGAVATAYVLAVAGQCNGAEDADDGDHDHQFDEREAPVPGVCPWIVVYAVAVGVHDLHRGALAVHDVEQGQELAFAIDGGGIAGLLRASPAGLAGFGGNLAVDGQDVAAVVEVNGLSRRRRAKEA
ncbi:hypothetical protein FQR65_LT20625 [Abscondita terminalis]|nr:hypothetical protein FQR65_LT20625 [Abscondita terminalis]